MTTREQARHDESERVALRVGDAVSALAELTEHSIDCVVTSPPYWGLRNYPVSGGDPQTPAGGGADDPRPGILSEGLGGRQLGREPSVEGYLDSLAAVFTQLARVLHPCGTLWLNLGDTFGGSWGNYVAPGSSARTAAARRATTQGPSRPPQTRCRPKDLQALPWRAVFMLTDHGWRARAAIVWHKPNARPESVRDRLAQRHEMLFLLSRTARHWWHPDTPATTGRLLTPGQDLTGLAPLWTISAPRARTGHLAPGPLELARRCLRHGCPPAGRVLDPFCGSGTTGLAALQLGHRFTGIDLDHTAIARTQARLDRWRP